MFFIKHTKLQKELQKVLEVHAENIKCLLDLISRWKIYAGGLISR